MTKHGGTFLIRKAMNSHPNMTAFRAEKSKDGDGLTHLSASLPVFSSKDTIAIQKKFISLPSMLFTHGSRNFIYESRMTESLDGKARRNLSY